MRLWHRRRMQDRLERVLAYIAADLRQQADIAYHQGKPLLGDALTGVAAAHERAGLDFFQVGAEDPEPGARLNLFPRD